MLLSASFQRRQTQKKACETSYAAYTQYRFKQPAKHKPLHCSNLFPKNGCCRCCCCWCCCCIVWFLFSDNVWRKSNRFFLWPAILLPNAPEKRFVMDFCCLSSTNCMRIRTGNPPKSTRVEQHFLIKRSVWTLFGVCLSVCLYLNQGGKRNDTHQYEMQHVGCLLTRNICPVP